MNGVVKVLGNCFTTARVTRQQNIATNIALDALNVILLFSHLHSNLLISYFVFCLYSAVGIYR